MFQTILNLDSHWFWFSIGALFLIAEIIVPGTFFMLLFSIAALLTVVCTFFTDNIWMLLFLFGVFSALGVLLIKPVLEKIFETIDQKGTTEENSKEKVGSGE
jgi:membrane protein implicated in regulation of membrane protease activity